MVNQVQLAKQKRSSPPPAPERKSEGEAHVITDNSDVALLSGPTEDGKGMTLLRAKRGRLEAGVVRPLEPGKPIVGEVVSLKPRKSFPILCDVETHVEAPGAKASQPSGSARSGPPQVASENYRQNWDMIYNRNKKPKLLN